MSRSFTHVLGTLLIHLVHPLRHTTATVSLVALAATAPAVSPAASATAALPGDWPALVLATINGYRQQQGLAPWQADTRLAQLAERHSAAMAQQQRLAHDGFEGRLADSGRRLCVENLAAVRPGWAATPANAQRLLQAWQRSPEHHANLLDAAAQRAGLAMTAGYLSVLACSSARVDGRDPP